MANTDDLISSATAAASAQAFSALSNAVRREDEERDSEILSSGAGGKTVEQITRELLRPVLREWLDQHLPQVVERLVRQEIERLSRRS